jgi:putative nucleotidyltransferase with HDIG domain
MGLVHDIGKVLLVKAFNEYQAQSNSFQINDVMKTIQEVHTSIGGAILQKWGFHQEFINIARKHTGPKFSDNTNKEILIVNLANYLTRNMGYSLFNDEIELSSLDSVRLLEIKEDQLEVLNEEMKKTMEATNNIF